VQRFARHADNADVWASMAAKYPPRPMLPTATSSPPHARADLRGRASTSLLPKSQQGEPHAPPPQLLLRSSSTPPLISPHVFHPHEAADGMGGTSGRSASGPFVSAAGAAAWTAEKGQWPPTWMKGQAPLDLGRKHGSFKPPPPSWRQLGYANYSASPAPSGRTASSAGLRASGRTGAGAGPTEDGGTRPPGALVELHPFGSNVAGGTAAPMYSSRGAPMWARPSTRA
jgi:hypothetical protein